MSCPELIVMLTYNDLTVENASEVFEQCCHSKAKYFGFKEEPMPLDRMKALFRRMQECGKHTALEVVGYTEAEGVRGARMAVECGCELLLGTYFFDEVAQICREHGIRYFPYIGEIEGRPSVLSGEFAMMCRDARRVIKAGADGVNLLGYRYIHDADALIEAVVTALDHPVVVAGSVNSYDRLDEIKRIHPWAFTIGGAFFDNVFGDTIAEGIDAVVDYMNK